MTTTATKTKTCECLFKLTPELKRKRRRRRTKIKDYDNYDKLGNSFRTYLSRISKKINCLSSLAMFKKVLLTLFYISLTKNIVIVTSSSSLLPAQFLQTPEQQNSFPVSPITKHENGFQLYTTNEVQQQNGQSQSQSQTQQSMISSSSGGGGDGNNSNNQSTTNQQSENFNNCNDGLLTFELSTGFIYKPSSAETLAMMPSTLQLTDCLDYCLHNTSCLAINFEMGLCVLLSSSAKQNPVNLYSSQFPVFTIYAEKKCLLSGNIQASKQRRRCQRAWTFERVAGYEMKTRPKRKLKLVTKEQCMEACLTEREFECRSANWYRQTGECTLSDQDRHSVSQSEAGDQQIKASLHELYGPTNLTLPSQLVVARPSPAPITGGLYQNYYLNVAGLQESGSRANLTSEQKFDELSNANLIDNTNTNNINNNKARRTNKSTSNSSTTGSNNSNSNNNKHRNFRQLFINNIERNRAKVNQSNTRQADEFNSMTTQDWPPQQYVDMPANALVDYLENNCVYEPNKLCEFRKIQNRVLKTVDSIYQDVATLDECKQKCLNAPYRCYSFDYGDTSERVCRTSHLDQASLLSVKEPYLDVVGAITYELASCFNVSIQCRAREMVALVSSSKTFKGKIYVKSKPNSCVNDVKESLKFELSMKYHDEACDVKATSTSQQGVFSNDIVIQHHDRIVTTQDVGLSVYCQYDLGNKSITNNVDLAIERIDDIPLESKNQPGRPNNNGLLGAGGENFHEVNGSSLNSPLTITSLATTVVKSPNVTMRITNMNGQPVTSATVGDRLALLFEIKEKTSPFGIFVREIIAMDGRQVQQQLANNSGRGSYHYGPNNSSFNSESSLESIQVNAGNSIQFIDSQGCPTDANIMGPLVKMDANGHRILAPFDAFKFPTSDMVFFRAVVSSCIAECKPVLCNSYDQEISSSAAATTTQASFTTKKTTPFAYLTSSTVAPTVRHHHHNHHNQHHFGGSDSPTNMATTSRRNNVDTVMSSRLSTTILPSSAQQTNRPLSASTPNLDLIYTTLSDFPDLNLPLTNKQTNNQDQRLSSGGVFSSTIAPSLMVSHNGQQMWDQNVGQNSSTNSANMTTNNNNNNNNNNNTSDHKPSKQSLESQSTNQVLPAGDSLTTVPGFAPQQQQQQQQQENASTSAVGDANNQQQLVVNMTNNHQLGKAPLRPTIVPSMGDKTIGPPIDLNKLSKEQKQQLVKLFESKLKQPFERNDNGSISEMADFYTGFLTSIMMNGIEGSDLELAEKKHQQAHVQDRLEQHKHVTSTTTTSRQQQQQQIEDNYKRNEKLAQILGEHKLGPTNRDINIRPAAPELDSLPSPHLLKLRLNKTIELVAAEITRLLQKQLANHDDQQDVTNLHPLSNKQSHSDNFNNLTKNNLGENYFDDLTTQATSTSNSTMLILPPPQFASQQSLDSTNRSVIRPSVGSPNSRLKTRTTETISGPNNNNNNRANSVLQGAKLTSITKNSSGQEVTNEINPTLPASASYSSASSSVSAAQMAKLKKASMQALADSYLGAYQPTFNKRRNKRRRRRSIKESRVDDSSLFPGYVYLEQAQEATLAPSLSGHTDVEARFTQGIVEMYHTTSDSTNRQINYLTQKQKQHQVTKRDINSNQNFYDVDEELVVQSIKIVDRLQFPDEENQTSGDELRGNGNKSTHRSQSARTSNYSSSAGHNFGSKENSDFVATASGFHDKLDKFDEEPEQLEDGKDHFKLVSLSSSGALSLIILALSFVFVQIFLVIICLIDWNRHKISSASRRKSLARSSQDLSSIDCSSTISNIGCKPSTTLSRSNSVSSMYIYLYK